MSQAVNYARGVVRVRAECPYPERLVNVCAANGVEFWGFERVDATTVRLKTRPEGYRKLCELSGHAGFTIEETDKTGAPYFLRKIRKRYVLLSGLIVMLLAVWSLSLFVWEIDVKGNKTVSSQEILEALGEEGVGIGSFGPTVSTEAISNDMLLKIPELQWIAVNVRGSHADVLVRERIPKPALLDKTEPIMVYAVKPGIITRMSVLEGKNVCKAGNTVEAGDVLVTGIMDSLTSGRRSVHAMAEVWARTWYELASETTLQTEAKNYTGREKSKTALIFAGGRLNFYFNGGIPFTDYDKITKAESISLPWGYTLPISVVRETYREYLPSETRLPVLDAEQMLQKRLLGRLTAIIGDGGVTTTDFSTKLDGDVLTVTLKAECLEQIAAERPFTPEETQEASLQPAKENK